MIFGRRMWWGRDPKRFFDLRDCRRAYLRQRGRCRRCWKAIAPERGHALGYEADHIVPWSRGGKTHPRNLQLLCPRCNRKKGNR